VKTLKDNNSKYYNTYAWFLFNSTILRCYSKLGWSPAAGRFPEANLLQRDAMQNAVMPQFIVRLSVCDGQVCYSHRLEWFENRSIPIIQRLISLRFLPRLTLAWGSGPTGTRPKFGLNISTAACLVNAGMMTFTS